MKKLTILIVAVLFYAFAFAQTRVEMKQADIPKIAAEYIAKNFTGYKVDKVFRCDNKGKITCEVTIAKGSDKKTLVFDKDGKFLKKEVEKAEVKPPVKQGPGKK